MAELAGCWPAICFILSALDHCKTDAVLPSWGQSDELFWSRQLHRSDRAGLCIRCRTYHGRPFESKVVTEFKVVLFICSPLWVLRFARSFCTLNEILTREFMTTSNGNNENSALQVMFMQTFCHFILI